MAPTTARQTFRETVAQVAEAARAKLPEAVNGRIALATRLVLWQDVEPQADGSILVGSSSDPGKTHRLAGDTCTCQDWHQGKAPAGWCQHRIAAGIHKRVGQMLAAEAPEVGTSTREDITFKSNISPPALPEAPASCNVRVLIAGHEVQWTLRGHNEAQVFDRLRTLLTRPDVTAIPKPAPRSGGNWKRSNQGR